MEVKKGILGNAIRSARIEHKLSQEELAEIVGITPTHLKHIESEHRKPSIEVLFRLAKTLHLSIDNILFDSRDLRREKIQELENLLTLCSEKELQIVCDLIHSLFENR